MVNVKEENKRQSNNIKEWTNRLLDNQRQQLENTTSTFSETPIKSIIILINIEKQTEQFFIGSLING
jgi:hypothetical protein